MTDSSAAVPPGWYPDPAGTRQWRVWTGVDWSEVTRPFGDPVEEAPLASNLTLLAVLRRVRDVGIVGVLGGMSLLVGVLAHWPGTAEPAPRWFAYAASDVAVALLLVGTVVCAVGVQELQGRWSLQAVVPGVNFFVVSYLVTRRLGHTRVWRVVAEVVLLALFAAAAHDDLWLCVGPIVVAYVESSWCSALIDRLAGPPLSRGVTP